MTTRPPSEEYEDDADEYADEYADEFVDESDIRAGYGIIQCLPVQDDDDDPCAAYLRSVRREAEALPNVVTAVYDGDTGGASCIWHHAYENEEVVYEEAIDEWDECGNCRDHDHLDRRPNMAWARAFLKRYASLRRGLQRIRDGIGDPYGKCVIALSEPSLLGLSQSRLHEQLVETADALELQGVTRERSMRIYEICALVEWPCHSNTLATMSRLLRICQQRRSVPQRPSEADLAMLNVIIVVCGGVFRQDEELCCLVAVEEDEDE